MIVSNLKRLKAIILEGEKFLMNNTPIEMQHELELKRQRPKENTQKQKNILLISLLAVSILLWIGVLFGGYWFANQYIETSKADIDTRIDEIETQNQKEVAELQLKLDEAYQELVYIKEELAYIEENLALTGESLNGSDETKVALQQRIDELNKQLKELQASIQKLEDAAR